MTVRCKFRLAERTSYAYGNQEKFTFRPEYDTSIPEDQRFQKARPSGEFTITVDNPAVQASYKAGDYYYFDSTPVHA